LEDLMRVLVVVIVTAVAGALAQAPEPPLADTRLTVHTLLREDVFSGFMANDMVRFARAERNIEQLFNERQDQRGNLLAWKGFTTMYRAVLAHESGDKEAFAKHHGAARAAFAEAATHTSGNNGVTATAAGTMVLFADRLPEPHRAAAWADAYANYALLWKQQGPTMETFPVHHRGEVLGGLVQSAQRTGRTGEAAEYLERMIALTKGTPYETSAQQWKTDPAAAATTRLTCKGCHNPGRLASRLASLQQQY
jgi:hypothetical protein